ncbi:hypothetical protein [Allokutzneria sp. NRRL B-24872]|uniref:hypothetical protein n=1 Tax=Allokutzneria sp. NRRL B-24872 TaxID=1137961 RepID=UPI000A3666B8|nr:hypothetical protein [Allokutzneria sp. NRRL B-24872]
MRVRTALAGLVVSAIAVFLLVPSASVAGELITAVLFGVLALGLCGGVVVATYRSRSQGDN